MNELARRAFDQKLKDQALKPSFFGTSPPEDLKPLTAKEKLQSEIDTLKNRLEIIKNTLDGKYDHCDPDDWEQ